MPAVNINSSTSAVLLVRAQISRVNLSLVGESGTDTAPGSV